MKFKYLVLLLTCLLCISQTLNAQNAKEKEKIALLVSENYSKPVAEAIQLLNESAEFSNHFEVFTVNNSKDQLIDAKIAVCYVHTGQVIERYSENLMQIVEKGGFVYAVGETPAAEEYQSWGMRFDAEIDQFFENPSPQNIKQLVLHLTNKHLGTSFPNAQPQTYPEFGIVDWKNGKVYSDFETFNSAQDIPNEEKPWIAFYTFRYEIVTGQIDYLKEYAQAIEQNGFRPIILFGFPLEAPIEKFCIDPSGKSRIDVLVNFSSIPGGAPDKLARAFEKLGVPVINAISLSQSKSEWDKSQIGIPIGNRTMALVRPEIMGQIQPTVVSTQELKKDKNNQIYTEKTLLKDRVSNLVTKIKAWSALRRTDNSDKDITLIYYNGHPGKHNIGASYLNVLPRSIYSIIKGLHANNYDLGERIPDMDRIFDDVMSGGRNIGTWAPQELDRLVKENKPALVGLETYKSWFKELNQEFQEAVIKKWGSPDSSRIMVWKDEHQNSYFVLPKISYGKLHLMPQPARGWEENEEAMFHDVNLPPHHQYIAFYLYQKHQLKTNALIHLGTHGTLEWLSGREAGADSRDASDALIGGMVNINPYIMDNVGEGTQAKRRGMAVIIDHLTPSFQESGLRPELKKLAGLINDYNLAKEKSPATSSAYLKEINQSLVKNNLNRDLNLDGELKEDNIQKLEHYLQEINEKQVPMGMHTFGVSPDTTRATLTATAMVNRLKEIDESEREKLIEEYTSRILASGPAEMQGLLDALEGKFISPATGNDPLRNPDALPTGKNFYGFDPSRMPSQGIYAEGEKLAEELISNYLQKHNGQFPDKVAFNLWSVETLRHEGIMESQILNLLGVKPKYDGFGKVRGIQLIGREELGRPRVDVVVTPSGLYRDMFPQFMQLMDQAINLVYRSTEEDNSIRIHVDKAIQELNNEGLKDSSLIKRLAMVRLFSSESGSYGLGVDDAVQATDKWEGSKEIADVYFNRASHLYGQGFWGEGKQAIEEATGKDLAISLFKKALSGTKAVVHSRSTKVYGALDNDDLFQYLGGMTLAIKQIDGTEPDIMISNLTDPGNMKQESLDKFIGRELNSRYYNPEWIKKMLDEGYAGARMIGQVVDNMWGWQATTDHAIRSEDWEEWNNVYVNDKYGLDIKEKFLESGNLYAYQQMLARMMEVIRKDKWTPDQKTMSGLMDVYLETVEETGLTCSDQVCGNEKLIDFMKKTASTDLQKNALENLQQALGKIHNSSSNATNPSVQKAMNQNRQDVRQKDISSRIGQKDFPEIAQNAIRNKSIQKAPKISLKGYRMKEEKLISLKSDSNNIDHKNLAVLILFLGIIGIGILFRAWSNN